MTVDYAEPLKRAWGLVRCVENMCRTVNKKYDYCEGHAALLEMVSKYHMRNCNCLGNDDSLAQNCLDERRRLRAAVGVKNGKK